MTDPIRCPFCGAKLRATRSRCPRCRARLEEPPPLTASPSPLAGWRTGIVRRGRLLVGAGVTVALGLLGGALWRSSAPAPAAPPSPAPAKQVVSRATPPAAPVPGRSAAAPPFLDAGKAGNYAYARGDYEAALRRYEEALARNPDDAEAHSNLGQVLVRLNRAAEALPHFERAIALIPTRWAYHFNLAFALGRLNQWERAVAEYRVAATLFPDDYATHFNLGKALHHAGDEEGAVRAYRRAIELAPEEGSFYVALGLSYERLKRPAEAAAAYERALELGRDAPDAHLVRARLARLRQSGAAPPGRGSPP